MRTHRPAQTAIFALATLLSGCSPDGASERAPPDAPPAAPVGRPLGTGAEPAPVLGEGWDEVSGLRREVCLTTSAPAVIPSPLAFVGSVTAMEALASLGLADLLHTPQPALLGEEPRSAVGRLLVDQDYAIDHWLLFDLRFDYLTFGPADRRWLVDPASADFQARCGDEAVRGLERGGQLLIGARFETGTSEDRRALLQEFGGPPAWTGASADAERRRLASWKGRAFVRVVALQRGGDPSMLSAQVGDGTTAAAWVLDCAVDDLAPCDAFLGLAGQTAWKDAPGSFLATVESMPVVVGVDHADWAVLGGPDLARRPPTEVVDTRWRLAEELSSQVAVQTRLSVLASGRLDLAASVAARLPAWQEAAAANLALLADALRDCHGRVTDPGDAAQAARCVAGGSHAALVARGFDEGLTAAALQAFPPAP